VESKSGLSGFIVGALILGVVVLLGLFLIPWESVKWGQIQLSSANTVMVTGQAERQERSQIASFVAGVSAVNDDKDTAISEVNDKVAEIISSLKDFGIDDEDLKTQNLSVNQVEETYYEEGRQKQRPGQWRISNSVEIKLRDVDRASALANLLTQSGATNVYGPNFTLDDVDAVEEELLKQAMENAQEKAQTLALLSGRTLGRVISVTEGAGTSRALYNIGFEGGGGGAPVEPGSGTVEKSVTVIFALE
jgi:hypothetical protein